MRHGTSSARWPAGATFCTSPTASWPPPRTWRTSINTGAGSSASCRALAARMPRSAQALRRRPGDLAADPRQDGRQGNTPGSVLPVRAADDRQRRGLPTGVVSQHAQGGTRALTRQQQAVARTQPSCRNCGCGSLSPRTRYRQRAKVEEAVAAILEAHGAASGSRPRSRRRNHGIVPPAGSRPTDRETLYVRRGETRFELSYRSSRSDWRRRPGRWVLPLISNETSLSERDLLLAYKGQAAIERRWAQLKTDFRVAPVYLER